ncbi:MAG: TetR family transcriptional regulator [Chloroflexi bacterium]|nr:TetR family transcriptional regulator [Chloroflexota bacterium]
MVTPQEKTVDLRIRRTKKLLQEALLALMASKSFQDITVQDITDRAMVNRGTFYDHFADKYALMEYTLRESFRQTLNDKLPPHFSFTAENLGLLILATCEFLAALHRQCLPSEREQFPIHVQTQITSLVQEILSGWFRAAHAANRRDAADLAAAVTSWAIYGAALHWSQGDQSEPVTAFVPRVLPIIMAGVSPA